jgi:hypothetical protein
LANIIKAPPHSISVRQSIDETFSTAPSNEITDDSEKDKIESPEYDNSVDIDSKIGDISDLEYKLLNNHIKSYSNATPRQIRIFYFRYLLGSNILLDSIKQNESDEPIVALNLLNTLLFIFTTENYVVADYIKYRNKNEEKRLNNEALGLNIMAKIDLEVKQKK